MQRFDLSLLYFNILFNFIWIIIIIWMYMLLYGLYYYFTWHVPFHGRSEVVGVDEDSYFEVFLWALVW